MLIDFGFTGTQIGTSIKQFLTLTKLYRCLFNDGYRWQHNGSCIGADEDSGLYWHDALSGFVYLHTPTNKSKIAEIPFEKSEPAKDYLIRNKDIVDCSAILVATPKGPEELRSGTWSTIRYARKQFKPIHIIYPDGSHKDENVN